MELAFCAKRESTDGCPINVDEPTTSKLQYVKIENLFDSFKVSIQVKSWAEVNKSEDISGLTGYDPKPPSQIVILNAFSLSANQR